MGPLPMFWARTQYHFFISLLLLNESPLGKIQCAKRCLEHSDCLAVFYSKSKLECRLNYLNNNIRSYVPDEYKDYVQLSRQEIKEVLHVSSPCVDNPCLSKKRCVILNVAVACIPFSVIETKTSNNVAVNKRTLQSSTYDHLSYSKHAVDGDWIGNFLQGTCGCTKYGYRNWWTVDLGQIYSINKIVILNRSDCCGKRLRNFGVYISSNTGNMDIVGYYNGYSFTGELITFSFVFPILGNHVKIILYGYSFLTLCEVGVYANV